MTVGGMGFIPERLLMMMMMRVYGPILLDEVNTTSEEERVVRTCALTSCLACGVVPGGPAAPVPAHTHVQQGGQRSLVPARHAAAGHVQGLEGTQPEAGQLACTGWGGVGQGHRATTHSQSLRGTQGACL